MRSIINRPLESTPFTFSLSRVEKNTRSANSALSMSSVGKVDELFDLLSDMILGE